LPHGEESTRSHHGPYDPRAESSTTHVKIPADDYDQLFMDFMDLYQHGQIKKAHQSVGQVASQVRHQRQATRDEMQALHERIDRLTLTCEALWNLLAASADLSEEELVRAITELDGDDGTVDGRRTRGPQQCSCGAMVNQRLKACQFCGEPAPVQSVFGAI